MEETKNPWLTIIPPMTEGEFQAFLERWRQENESVLGDINPERFVIDDLRGENGKGYRRLRMKLS